MLKRVFSQRTRCSSLQPQTISLNSLRVLCLASLLFALHGGITAQESCELEEVKIGFQAETCPYQDYSITLNGAAATGFGTGCLSFAQFPNLTNKAWTKLKLNKPYVVTAGSALCITHINFDVPEGYELFINGIRSKTIFQTNGGAIYSGDGAWNVVVRKKCPCPNDPPGKAKTKTCSVIWDGSLGQIHDGRSAESISLREKQLTAATYTPAALVFTPPGQTSDIEVINSSGNLRQVKAPQTTADIVTISANEYEIRYYQPADVGPKSGGLYAFTGSPFVTWNFKNPNLGTFSKLEITKIENGQPTDKIEYTWDGAIDSWTMRSGWTAPQTYDRTETKTVSYPTPTSRMETFIVKGSSGAVVSQKTKTYLSYPWGEELVQEVSDPAGAALTTTYTYYENPNEDHRYQKLQTVTFPDGSWEKYDYDNSWNISKIIRPWKDLSLATATENNSHVTIYGYTNSDNGVFGISFFSRILYDVEEKLNGVTVRKSRYQPSIANVDPDIISLTDSSYAGSDNGVPVNLLAESITSTYRFSAPEFLANRTAAVFHRDGTKDTYSYEKGNWVPNADPSLSQFVPDENGLGERQTVVHGTVAAPDGVAFKTTKDTVVRNQFGNAVLEETYVYDGAGYQRVEWTAKDYDGRGHLTTTRNSRGETRTVVWTGERKTSEIDAAGIETVYTYDTLGRVATETKKGIASGGGFPAQADIVTTFSYDADNQPMSETIASGGLTLTSDRKYDRAGRVIEQTGQDRLTASYRYANGGRTQTVTRAGGATQVIDHYLDRQNKSVTGTAVVARYFDYGVNVDGTSYTQEFTGTSGLSSPRWTKTTLDWMGRTIATESPSFTGTNILKSSIYNSLDQLQKETMTANASKALADRVYEYNELGQRVRMGLDKDSSGTLAPSSTDRLVESDYAYEKVGNDWFKVTTSKTYLADNNSTPITQVQRERLNNFTLTGTDQAISEITITDIAGNIRKSTITVDRAAKKLTVTVDTADSNLNGVTVSVNGLTQSSTTPVLQTATTYSYDALARQTGMTDPRAGTTTRTFSPTTGQLLTTNDGAGTTTYEYYPGTHLNAGQIKSEMNAAAKKRYFAYNARRQLTQLWGDTTQPLEYVYDSYGQQTELHSFRAGQNWSAAVWPASTTGTADVTKWTYQDATGLETQKQDATLKGPTFTYDELGRMKTRTWARGISCTYGYDPNTGELLTVTYSDNTPALSFTYDRGGRKTGITDAAGSHTRTFNVAGELATDQITGGLLDGTGVTVGYDGFLRRNSLQATQGANTLSSQTYGYDAASRLETITAGAQTATYAYHPSTGLLNTTSFTGGTNVARGYDSVGRLETITITPAAAAVQSYVYTHNNLNQRTRVTREDGTYWSYIYDDRNELVSGKKYWSDNSLVWGQQTEYSFDNIGNRNYSRSGGNQVGTLRQSNYIVNSLNQYTQRTVPGAIDVTGTANTTATVTVNNETTARKGDYFYKELAVDNSSGPALQQVSVTGARNNFGSGGEDAISQRGGQVLLAPATQTLAYDFDGNLISDGRWVYTWNAENQLVRMEAAPSVPASAKTRLEFSNDYNGRRIQKKVYLWDVPTSAYVLQSDKKFVYDRANLVAELDGANTLLRSFTWGQDLGGDLQTIAGIGGLLLVTEPSATYEVFSDANGNVVSLVNAANGTSAANYDYDPFGKILKSVGDYAKQNPFKFSSKYTDSETDLVYYGYRYYEPQSARWLGRDALAEEGGVNLTAFNSNDSINKVDARGLYEIDVHFYLTYYLASHHHCFTAKEATAIAEGDQQTDEHSGADGYAKTTPDAGWVTQSWDPTAEWIGAPAGILSYGYDDYAQQEINMYYHALNPGAAAGVGNPRLWEGATAGCNEYEKMGQYLHYLQDTFSHEGFHDPKCGHGCTAQHLPDHTRSDPEKTVRAAKATWDALNQYSKLVKCDCQDSWNPMWDQVILNFANIGFEFNIDRRRYQLSNVPAYLDEKIAILQVPMIPPGSVRAGSQ